MNLEIADDLAELDVRISVDSRPKDVDVRVEGVEIIVPNGAEEI